MFKQTTNERFKRWLPGFAMVVLIGIATLALYDGLVPKPVHLSPLTVIFGSGRISARTTVRNDTDKPLTITVHFELSYSTRGRRSIPPFMTVTPYDVVTHLDAYTSHGVSCDFATSGQKDQNTVTAVITKYE